MRSSPDRNSSGTGPATGTASIGNERLRVICHCALFRLRRIPRSRNNWLFAGSLRAGRRAAAAMSLIQSAKLNGHDPYAYLKDVLTRLPTQPASRLEELLPHRWQPSLQA